MSCNFKGISINFFTGFLTLMLVFIVSSLAMGQPSSIKTVVIDPGHGGKDPGNLGTGRYTLKEKDIALEVGLKLGAYIKEAYPEIKVIYTRKDDKFIELHERTEIANKSKADLFISIHCNSAKNTDAYGTETFVMGFKYDKLNRDLTIRENSVIFMEDNYEEKYSDFDPNNPESDMFAALYQNAFQDQSISFANYVEQQFNQRVGRRSRGVKQSILYVLNRSTMPSVLIELGFLSNRREEDFLNSELGQVYMASAIYRAFKEFKTQRESLDQSIKATVTTEQPKMQGEKPEKDQKQFEENPYGIVFKIQLLSSARQLNSDSKELQNVSDVEELQIDGRYKYVCGNYSTYGEAKKELKQVKKKGHEAAFIIALKEGQAMNIQDAIKQTDK